LRAGVSGDELHRAGPVQRHERDDVLEAGRRRLLHQLAHPARFELEHRSGIGRLEDVVGRAVVERQRLEGDVARGIEPLHVAQRPVEDRERGETQEVELHETDRLDVVLVELRHERVRSGLRVERAEVGELAGRDQHAARVHPDVARQSLERLREREELADLFLLLLPLASSGSAARAWESVTCLPGWNGISFAMPSQKRYGRSSTRPTSRTAALAAIVPKVAICATDSAPYFFFT
jgi:hypothetical protein